MAMKFKLNLKNIEWKKFFLEKGDKVALGVAAALGLYFLFSCVWTWLASDSPTTNAETLARNAKTVTDKIADPTNKPMGDDVPKPTYKLTETAVADLRTDKVPEPVLASLTPLLDKEFKKEGFQTEVAKLLNKDEQKFQDRIVAAAFFLPKLSKYEVEKPDLYAMAPIYPIKMPPETSRRQPRILLPDEGRVAVEFVQFKAHSMQFPDNGPPLIKVIESKNGKDGNPPGLVNGKNLPGGGKTMANVRTQQYANPTTGKLYSEDSLKTDAKSSWVTVDKLADLKNHKLAENILPMRIITLGLSFPYRMELDQFRENLRLGNYNAVLNEQSETVDPKTKQTRHSFRFLGVRVQRRTVDALGKPLVAKNDGWELIDLEGTFLPLVILTDKRIQKEDDPLMEKICIPGLVMPRLLQARDGQYKPIEKKLDNIKATLDSLVKVPEEERYTPPPQFTGEGFNIFDATSGTASATPGKSPKQPMGVTPMGNGKQPQMGPDGKPIQQPVTNPPEHVLVRLLDVTVKPGTIYQYRVQVRMANPNYKRSDVASPQYALGEELESDEWFEIKDKDGNLQSVVVPPEMIYYVVDQKELDNAEKARSYKGMNANQNVEKDRQVAFQIHRWLENAAAPGSGSREFVPVGEWVVAERVIVNRGEPIGRVLRVDVPIWKDTLESFIIPTETEAGRKVSGSKINFAHEPQESLLVDFEGPEAVAQHGANTVKEPISTEVLILSNDGKLLARTSESDKSDKDRASRFSDWRIRVQEVKDGKPAGDKPMGTNPFGK
jgi:hypothetical protein